MANYNGYTTSRFFKIKDEDNFLKELKEMNGEEFFERSNDPNHGVRYCLVAYDNLESCPSKYLDKDGNVDYDKYTDDDLEDNMHTEDDYYDFIQRHMDEDAVVVANVGHEKLRYLVAHAVIIKKDSITGRDFFDEVANEAGLDYIF